MPLGRAWFSNGVSMCVALFCSSMDLVGPICARALPSDGVRSCQESESEISFQPTTVVGLWYSPRVSCSHPAHFSKMEVAFLSFRKPGTDCASVRPCPHLGARAGCLGWVQASCWLWHSCSHKVAPKLAGASRPALSSGFLQGRRRRAEECGFEECLTQGRNSTGFFFIPEVKFSARKWAQSAIFFSLWLPDCPAFWGQEVASFFFLN